MQVVQEIHRVFQRFDMVEGQDTVGLYFGDFFFARPDLLNIFTKAFEQALPNSIANQKPVILLFRSDLAKLLGLKLHKETSIRQNLIVLDELTLETGDFIDIGSELHDTHAYPVTIKSLVFNQKKK